MTGDEKGSWTFLFIFFGVAFWFSLGGFVGTHGQETWTVVLLIISSTILLPMVIIWFIRLAYLAGHRRGATSVKIYR